MQIKKAELKKMYETTKTVDLAKKIGVSVPTLIRILKQAGIETKGSGNRQATGRKAKKVTIVD